MIMEDFGELEPHIAEQVIWRAKQAEPCTKNGSCFECGCSTKNLDLYYADKGCSKKENPCYPPMIKNKQEWEKYKYDNNIELH